MERRKFLTTLGCASITLTAGCGGKVEDEKTPTSENPVGEKSETKVPAPKVNLPEGWQLTTPNTESHVFTKGSWKGVLDYKAIGHTKRYENKQVRERVKKETFDKFDQPLVIGFATRLELDVFGGNITEGAVMSATNKIEKKAKSEFKSRMQKFGLKDVNKAGELSREWVSEPKKFTKYRGNYEVEPIEIKNVNIPNVQKDSFTLEGGKLPVEGLLGTWRKNGHIFVAGGVYPAEDYTRHKEWDITGGVHLDLSVELGLSRQQYLGEVIQFCKSVHS